MHYYLDKIFSLISTLKIVKYKNRYILEGFEIHPYYLQLSYELG